MSSLLETLKKQDSICLTGRLSIYDEQSNACLGHLLFTDGVVISAGFRKYRDVEAICKIIRLEVLDQISFIFELNTEEVEKFNKRIHLSYIEIKKLSQSDLNQVTKIRKLKPPLNLSLLVNKSFIINGENLLRKDFITLCSVLKYKKISIIYKNSIFDEDTITKSLIYLKRKNAIKVCQ